jgi:hypothetical protein
VLVALADEAVVDCTDEVWEDVVDVEIEVTNVVVDTDDVSVVTPVETEVTVVAELEVVCVVWPQFPVTVFVARAAHLEYSGLAMRSNGAPHCPKPVLWYRNEIALGQPAFVGPGLA